MPHDPKEEGQERLTDLCLPKPRPCPRPQLRPCEFSFSLPVLEFRVAARRLAFRRLPLPFFFPSVTAPVEERLDSDECKQSFSWSGASKPHAPFAGERGHPSDDVDASHDGVLEDAIDAGAVLPGSSSMKAALRRGGGLRSKTHTRACANHRAT